MKQLATIKFNNGLKQKTDDEASEGFSEVTDLDFTKVGRVQAIPDNDTAIEYGATVHSMTMEGLLNVDPLLVGVGTDVRTGFTTLKSNFSGEDLSFTSLTGRMYMTNPTNGLWMYNGGGTLYRAGAPEPGTAPTVTDSGIASSTTFQGIYNIRVTFTNSNGFDGNPTDATAAPSITDTKITVASIPTNSNADYNITGRKIWIQGGTSPQYASYVLAYTLSDNATTTQLVDVGDIDASTLLETDNNTPPAGKFVFENYGVLFMGGFDDSQSLRFSKTTEGEYWPTANDLNISRSSDPLMAGFEWNGSGWIVTRKRIFQVIGSPGQGTILTNFYIKETKSVAGTIAMRSVVPTPYGVYFWAEDGIRVFDGDKSTIFSNDVEDLVNARSTLSDEEDKIQGAFHDDKLFFSYIPNTGNTHDRTLVYDFRTGVWHKHGKGYRSFASDRKNNILFMGTTSAVERYRKGSAYRSWAIRKDDISTALDNIGFFGKFQVDLEGSCTAEVYQDDELTKTYSLSAPTRDFVVRRFPIGLARRVDLRFTGTSKSTQDILRSVSVSAEPGRERI